MASGSRREYGHQPPPGATLFLVEDTILGTVRLLWAYRLELAALAALNAVWRFAATTYGLDVALVSLVSLAAVVMVVSPLRRSLLRPFHCARLRRRWRRGCRAAGLVTSDGRLPKARRMRRRPAGDVVSVVLPPGANAVQLDAVAETLAACLRLREVRVLRDAADASRCHVTLVRRDTLAEAPALPWPYRTAQRLSLWEPIPLGVNEDGGVVTVSLPERNVLLGGEPGAGKSVALSLMVATAVLDSSCRLWLFDGKLVELAPWRSCAARSVGVSVEEANEVLRELQAKMDDRYEQLLASRRRKVEEGDRWPLEVVVCDELAHYLSCSDRKLRTEFSELMRDLVARGRAAGVIVLAATQKPSHDVIPTSLRDLFGFRWALRCSTPQASDTILGQGWASNGFSASTIDPAARGVGFLLHEGGVPVRLRSYLLSDGDPDVVADRAERLRVENEPESKA